MIIERDLDCAGLYRDKRRALMAFARTLGEQQLNTMVPATPEWRVRDVLAHLIGINADLNAGRLSAAVPGEWTRAQVETRRNLSLEERGDVDSVLPLVSRYPLPVDDIIER